MAENSTANPETAVRPVATVMPVIGKDGKLLGVTLNGITCVRNDDTEWSDFADLILNRIITLPRDTESDPAKRMLKADDERLKRLTSPVTIIELSVATIICCMCGACDLQQWGIPVSSESAQIVANDFAGECGAVPACRECFSKHEAGEFVGEYPKY